MDVDGGSYWATAISDLPSFEPHGANDTLHITADVKQLLFEMQNMRYMSYVRIP